MKTVTMTVEGGMVTAVVMEAMAEIATLTAETGKTVMRYDKDNCKTDGTRDGNSGSDGGDNNNCSDRNFSSKNDGNSCGRVCGCDSSESCGENKLFIYALMMVMIISDQTCRIDLASTIDGKYEIDKHKTTN